MLYRSVYSHRTQAKERLAVVAVRTSGQKVCNTGNLDAVVYRTDLECTDNMCGMTRGATGMISVCAESCVPTGMLDDFIVSLVTDSRRLRKGGIRKEKRRVVASTQTEELETHPC